MIKMKWVWFVLALIVLLLAVFWKPIQRSLSLAVTDRIGDIATDRMKSGEAAGSVAAEFINIPIKAREIAPDIIQITGVGNVHIIHSDEGDIMFDSGLALQSPKQIEALKKLLPKLNLTHIILSHSHADHAGGAKFWDTERAEIITHSEFLEEQRYLKELEPYFWGRNRKLFPFMPEKPPSLGLIAYGGVQPDRVVMPDMPLKLTLGGRTLELLAMKGGAEGSDNLVLWLPEERILFSGDFFGPIFPQFPNIFTMRGEKIRRPIEYIDALEQIIALEPKMIVPSHLDPITDATQIMAGLIRMRDATRYVHDEVIKGMNEGKTLHMLMQEIKLPADLELTQIHGKISWAVKSIWEYYATWFHYDRTTELYSVDVSEVYEDVLSVAGAEKLITLAEQHLAEERPLHALHLTDMVLEVESSHRSALKVKEAALEALLHEAETGLQNSYEIYWLRSRIDHVRSLQENVE